MKNLRNTLIIAVLAACLTTVTTFAQKVTKVADGKVVRSEVTDLLKNSDIRETGLVDVVFRLADTHIKVLSVEGNNLQLNKQVKSLLENNRVYLNGQIGFYKVRVNMNGASPVLGDKEVQQKLRMIIADVLKNSNISDKGEATVLFKVTKNNKIEVIDVRSQDEFFASSVKSTIDQAGILVPEGLKGKYEVNIRF